MKDQDSERLERELEALFSRSEPRRGFEDELWERLNPPLPLGERVRAWRRWPSAWPLAAVAAALLVVGGAGWLVLGRQNHASTGSAPARPGPALAGPGETSAIPPGRADRSGLPPPALHPSPSDGKLASGVVPYYGPADLTWSGTLPEAPMTAVVFIISDQSEGPSAADVPGPSYPLVDAAGEPIGVSVKEAPGQAADAGHHSTLEPLPSRYPVRTTSEALRAALSAPPVPGVTGITPVPRVVLTQAQLVYIAALPGREAYVEPAFLFRGTFRQAGVTYEKRVLVPALAPAVLIGS